MTAPVARIRIHALKQNLKRVREILPDCKVMTAIKANGYGHGLIETARAFEKADALAVARVDEGMELLNSGIRQKIVVLEGFANMAELMQCRDSGLEHTVHDASQLEMLARIPTGLEPLPVWLKIDTGMHRIGILPEHAEEALDALRRNTDIKLQGIMTHLANADNRQCVYTMQQLETFRPYTGLGLPVSVFNSAGILDKLNMQQDWVRPGIMLYGASPFDDSVAGDEGLVPAMTLRTRLIAVRSLKAGDAIGYGSTWTCPEDMQVGVAAIGYGDGYPRHAPNGTPVLVDGQSAKLVGRVSMDMVTLDLRTISNPRVGDSVVLWGEGLPVEDVARAAGTISYELFCRLTGRVKFRYEE